MVDITEQGRRHFTGLEADMASIPSPVLGDTFSASDSGKRYQHDGANWTKLSYVDRRVAVDDFDEGDFTTNGVWHADGLDLSAIVPSGAIAVDLKISLTDDAVDSFLTFRPNAVDISNVLTVRTQVANINIQEFGRFPIDADRKLDYLGSNLVFTVIRVSVLGWAF